MKTPLFVLSGQTLLRWSQRLSVAYVLAICIISYPSALPALEVGVIVPHGAKFSKHYDEWSWALGGGGIEVSQWHVMPSGGADNIPELLIVEQTEIPPEDMLRLKNWVHSGGLLMLSGPETLGMRFDKTGKPATTVGNSDMAHFAGVEYRFADPGLIGAYPYVIKSNPLLSPFVAGDGIRLGKIGIDHIVHLRVLDAEPLATTMRIRPGPGSLLLEHPAPSITTKKFGKGRILFLNFSLARIAACYPDIKGRTTDCSASGTAHGLMRVLIANTLWHEKGLQAPLKWESPGMHPLGLVITGDVHDDKEKLQIRSALQMAEIFRPLKIPLTFYVVDKVAIHAPTLYSALAQEPYVEIAIHPSGNRRHSSGNSSQRVSRNVREAEQMLGLLHWPDLRQWRTSVRSGGWNSDQTQAMSWTGMSEAGIGLVFDCNADMFHSKPQWTAPEVWFKAPIRKRLFIPMFEKNVSTAHDNFRLDIDLAQNIASVCSPEPDPCCNNAITFDVYTEYVNQWLSALQRLGLVGGTTGVWLWHPSTPAWKGGFELLRSAMEEMVNDSRVSFFHGSEAATWNYNRQRVQIHPKFDSDGRLVTLRLNGPDMTDLLPLPPESSPDSGTVSYWVLGPATVRGWTSFTWRDSYDRIVTVLSHKLPITKASR